MKINKNYILVLFMFLISGCTVNYDIEITDDTIKEIVEFNENIDSVNDNILYDGLLSYQNAIDNLYNYPQTVYIDADEDLYDNTKELEGVDYYKKEMILSENKYGLKANFNHILDNYQKSSTITKCYKNISVLDEGDTLTLSTSRNNLCFEQYKNLDEINVNITFNPEEYSIVSHNADEVIENKYSWTINRQNYGDKSIVIEFETLEAVRKRENAMYLLIGVIISVCVGAGVIYLIVKKQSQRKNEI